MNDYVIRLPDRDIQMDFSNVTIGDWIHSMDGATDTEKAKSLNDFVERVIGKEQYRSLPIVYYSLVFMRVCHAVGQIMSLPTFTEDSEE